MMSARCKVDVGGGGGGGGGGGWGGDGGDLNRFAVGPHHPMSTRHQSRDG